MFEIAFLKKKGKGYSLLEVMIALVIFSSGMISFMMYQAKANTTLFEAESSQMAYSLASALAEDINAMTPTEFYKWAEQESLVKNVSYLDNQPLVYSYLKSIIDAESYNVSPFNSRGAPAASNDEKYLFYRSVRFNHYIVKIDQVGSYTEGDPQAYLRHVDVIVGWPRKGHGSLKCMDFINFDENCNYVNIPVVRYLEPTT